MIEARGLTRTFRAGNETVEAVRGLDLDVRKGEMVAVLGPNGAGKSTTLRMLTTLLQPTAGTARVVGRDVTVDPAGVRSRIGYIGQGNSAGHSQRVLHELVAQGRCYGLGRREAARRGDALLTALDLRGLGDRTVSSLSGGQRRRLDVALGMVHRPALLFLDEPSTGLDPQNRANLQSQIERLRADHGTTIVLTTHYLDEADAMADRVVVVDHGTVIADDTPERLKADLAGDHIVITADRVADAPTVAAVIERTGRGVAVPGDRRRRHRPRAGRGDADPRPPPRPRPRRRRRGRGRGQPAHPRRRVPGADRPQPPRRRRCRARRDPRAPRRRRPLAAVPDASDLVLLEKAS